VKSPGTCAFVHPLLSPNPPLMRDVLFFSIIASSSLFLFATVSVVRSRSSYQISSLSLTMGNCLAVEVREEPVQSYDRPSQPRHTIVRQNRKSAYRRSDELGLYRPRSRLSIRHSDFQSQDDFRGFGSPQYDYNDQYRSSAQAEHRNDQRFEPLPPPVPPAPLVYNEPFRNNDPFRNNEPFRNNPFRNNEPFQNNDPFRNNEPFHNNDPFRNNDPHDLGGIVDLGGHQPHNHQPHNHNNEIQVIEEPAEIVRRSPRSNRGRRQIVVHSSRRSGHERRYYDDSDDDSWVQRSPRIRYSDDYWGGTYRPRRQRSSRRRSRSRTNGRNHR
jgi:hypothetical protein